MSTPIDDESWKTPEVREAEAALDRAVRKSEQLLKDLDKIKIPPLPKVDPQARIDALKKAASQPDAPAQLRLIKKKVDEGKLTWDDVVSGKAFADPEVRALADQKLGEAKEIMEELEEGQSPEEILEARTGGSGSMIADTGRSSAYPAPGQDRPAGYSAENPLASSDRPAYPAPAEPEHTGYSNDDPLAVRRPHPEPAPEEPPAEPEKPSSAPPPRHRAHEETEDDFADPLAPRDKPRQPPPSGPPSSPPPSSGRRARRDEPGEDDDYFGGSFMR